MDRTRLVLFALALIVVCVVVGWLLWRTMSGPASEESGGAGAVASPPTVVLKPGRFKITVTNITKVAKDQPPGPYVDEQCLDTELPTPRGHVPPGCRTFELKQSGAEVTWRLRCMGARQGDGTGRMTLSEGGEHLEGEIRLWLPNPVSGTPLRHDQAITGVRVGECAP